MNPKFLVLIILYSLSIQYTNGQLFNLTALPIFNSDRLTNLQQSISNGSLMETIRGGTQILITRLEGPRDRVVEFIKPAVKSNFSRNITQTLSTVFNRVQSSNISLINSPIIQRSIMKPINNTLERLNQITADDNSQIDEANVEIIHLDPTDKLQFTTPKEYLGLFLDENVTSLPQVVRKYDELESAHLDEQEHENKLEFLKDEEDLDFDENSEKNFDQQINDETDSDNLNTDKISNKENSRQQRRLNIFNMFSRDRITNFLDAVQRKRLEKCVALVVCESNCKPKIFGHYSDSIRNFFSRLETIKTNHPDYDYYIQAMKLGQKHYSGGNDDDEQCNICADKYYCAHDRSYMIEIIPRLGGFY